VGNGDQNTNILIQERHFLPVLKNWVSMPSTG